MLIFSLILIQIIIFGGLIFLLKKLLTQNVVAATKHLDDLNQDFVRKEREINGRLEDTNQKTQSMLIRAQEDAEKIKLKIIADAEAQKNEIISHAETQAEDLIRQADKSRELLLSEIEKRIEEEAIVRACELIQDTLPENLRLEVHQHWTEELIGSVFSQWQRLHIPKDIGEVKITAAFILTDKQRGAITKELKKALNDDIMVKEEVDPKVVAGFIITIGSLVLDGSLKNKIQENSRKHA